MDQAESVVNPAWDRVVGWFKTIDRILRGEATRPEELREKGLDLPVGGLLVVVLLLALASGACVGCYALFTPGHAGWVRQWVSATLKVPALFALTFAVTFPSLYVSNALIGSRLKMDSLLRLLIAALSVNVTVLASLGPIVAFFGVSTSSYPFIKLLTVAVFALSGVLGLNFLTQTLNRLADVDWQPEPKEIPTDETAVVDQSDTAVVETELEDAQFTDSDENKTEAVGPLDQVQVIGPNVKFVMRCWIVLFGLVGAQMGWVLRPFIGNPDAPFVIFRGRDSNFFEGVLNSLWNLFGG
ncbi:MAG: hypothetical protein AAF497_22725 [Planctomycetota bacterium]